MSYFKTRIELVILTKLPPSEELTLGQLEQECKHGSSSADAEWRSTESISSAQMAWELVARGSDPEFFQLDVYGNPSESEDDLKLSYDPEIFMRSLGWMKSSEVFDDACLESPLYQAMKLLNEESIDEVQEDLKDSSAMKFFNPKVADFSPARDWEELAEMEGVELKEE